MPGTGGRLSEDQWREQRQWGRAEQGVLEGHEVAVTWKRVGRQADSHFSGDNI